MTTINYECYVSPELAKLLKKAGFDWECMCYYTLRNSKIHIPNNGVIAFMKKYEELFRNHNETKLPIYSAPTLDVAQRWLREVKEIEVNTLCVYINNAKKYSYSVFEGKYNNERIEEGFDTFEEALEAGIKKALEIILNKGE